MVTPAFLCSRMGGAGGGRFRQRHFHHHHREDQRETNAFSALIQLMPILLILFLSLFSSFFVSDPIYSLHQTQKYSTRRVTSNLRIPYYVKDNFHTEFQVRVLHNWMKNYEFLNMLHLYTQGSLRRLESSIEEDYLNGLRQACFREKSYKENLLWQARYSGNSNLLNRAHNYATPSCEQLEKIYSY